MPSVDPNKLVVIGRIYRAHGIRGELKVIPETDDPERFLALDTVYTGSDAEALDAHDVGSIRFQHTKRGPTVIAAFTDITDRDEADRLRKQYVFALEDDLHVGEDDIFIDDLIGIDVETKAGTFIGTVREIIETPAQHVFVVARPEAPDALIPNVPEFVIDIDEEEGRLVVDPIEGLFE